MREFIDNCISELDDNRAYLHPLLPLWLLFAAGGGTDPIDKFVTGIEQTLGLLLFVFVVVPLGLFGKAMKR